MKKNIFKILIALTLILIWQTPMEHTLAATCDRYWVGGTASWNGTALLKWSTTSGGIGGAAEPTATDNVCFDSGSGNVTVTVATSNRPALNIKFDGDGTSTKFVGTFAGSQGLQVSGSVTLASGITWTHTGTFNFISTSAQTLTSNGLAITSPINLNGTGSTVTLQDALNTTGRLTVTDGTFDANNKVVAVGGVTCTSNTNTRIITFGNQNWTISASFSCTGATGLTLNASGSNLYFTNVAQTIATSNSLSVLANVFYTGSGTCSFSSGTGIWGNVTVSSGTDFNVVPNIQINSLDFTGFTGTWSGSAAFKMAGNLTIASGMTVPNTGTTTNNLNGAITLNGNGVSIGGSYTVTGGGSVVVTQTSDFKLASTATLSMLITGGGTWNMAGYNLTAGLISATGSTTRTFTYSSGTIELTGTGTVFNVGTTNLTITANTATLKISDASASTKNTASGSVLAFPKNFYFTGAGSGSLTVNGNLTITGDFKIDTAPKTVLFNAGGTITVGSFTAVGSAGNEITINTSGGSTSTHKLVKTGGGTVVGDYLNIQHSIAEPYSTWFAGLNSTNNQATATAGNGWIFNTPAIYYGNFFFGM